VKINVLKLYRKPFRSILGEVAQALQPVSLRGENIGIRTVNPDMSAQKN
jgi:hypothetical protein